MNGYFLALIIIYVLSLGVTVAKHGQPREGNINFYSSVVVTGIVFTLIYMAVKTGF